MKHSLLLDDQPRTATQTEKVAILLSTYNGAAYLAEQLDSLVAQTHTNWQIYASDDGSGDATLEILRHYQHQLGGHRLTLFEGPRQGFAANFLGTLQRQEFQAQYYAFCDQDDLWQPDRLALGIAWMRNIPDEQPALYCSRTQLVDAQGQPLGLSPLFSEAPSFRNALVQSIAGGNTMLFNQATRALLQGTDRTARIISHDWWTYILVSGCGGQVFYNPEPTIRYRQHERNLMGSNSSLNDRLKRLGQMFAGTFREWNDANLHALAPLRNLLTRDNQTTLELFEQARHASLPQRALLLQRSGVYRQTLTGNLGLAAATLLQRI
ncbi:glycosyltransferase family 2 protein [Pseudomonas sp. UL073]|uniref:Glycosyltransferase family 2 protein n=2 Tax=Zestomonas insulae TaxID=2809017 RepID=A0ABS2IJB7_9GAMM|nr:glycosyltransferase family 2 protein [Pseudomonas insulae]